MAYNVEKSFVLIRKNTGDYKIWRDYGTAWGSPEYEVIDYFDSYKEARKEARLRKQEFSNGN